MKLVFKVTPDELNRFRIMNEKKVAIANLLKIPDKYNSSIKSQLNDQLDSICQSETILWRNVLGDTFFEKYSFFIDLSTGNVYKEDELCTKRN